MSVPARTQLCRELTLCTGTGQVWGKLRLPGCPAKPRKGSRAHQWACHILWDTLWVQAAGAGKPWSGLCHDWGSCDNRMRWQRQQGAFKMLEKQKGLSFGTTWELRAEFHSWKMGIRQLFCAKVLRTGKGGMVDTTGAQGEFSLQKNQKQNKRKNNIKPESRGFWQQGVLRAYTTEVTQQISHKPLGWGELYTLPSNVLKKFSQTPSKWWQVLLFLLAAKLPSSPNLLE